MPFLLTFAERIANEPQRGAQAPRVFFVGGTVRDRVRGVAEDAVDVDVEVYGVPSKRVQEVLEEMAMRKVDALGAAFGVYKLSFADGVLDVAIPRTESKKGTGHKGFTVLGDPQLSYADALCRRDFTMNAMLADVLTGEIIDPFGGRDDIVRGVLRVVDAHTFCDDPLRVFRAMQFVARFGYVVEPQSLQLFCEMATSPEVAALSRERVTAEWKKMLCGAFPEAGLRFLADTGLLALYPELDALRITMQDPAWHPEGSVWEHVLRCFAVSRAIAERAGEEVPIEVLRLALLLHDAGKPAVMEKRRGKIVDVGHAEAGAAVARVFFARCTFGEDIERAVIACTRHHERLPELYRAAQGDEMSEAQAANALRMLWRDVGVERVPLYLAVCEANARGRDLPLDDREYPVGVWARRLTDRHHLLAQASMLLVTGEDLQALAARLQAPLPKGKAFGMLLAKIEDARDAGEVATRPEALQYAETLLRF